jgi:glutamate-1-semialdehyde 2,1-aminomutase
MRPYPIYIDHGLGCRVWDIDGDERIDVINNFTAAIHGYAVPQINEAVTQQLARGTAFGAPTLSEIVLAELLCARVESIEEVRFMNSGSEAVMTALKAARSFTSRPKVAKTEGAYHGSYDYAEVSLDSPPAQWSNGDPRSISYARGTPQGVLDDVVVLPFNDIEASVRLIDEHGAQLAAVLVDPMPNRGGLVPADKSYLEALRIACDRTGTLLIFDEVISFRLGFQGAQAIWGIEADLTVLGKIIGGGFPVGAVGGRRKFMSVFDPTRGKPALPHGGTFSANPMTMTAGLAAMQLLDRQAFARLDHIGDVVRSGVTEAFARSGLAGQVTGLGSLIKIHFTNAPIRDYRSSFPSPAHMKMMEVFTRALINRSLLPSSYGLMALSTAMTDTDICQIVDAVEEALDEVRAKV